MKYISFKILILGIILPPVLYIFSMLSLEKYLQDQYTREVENNYIGDTRPLFDGNIRIQDAIRKNMDRLLHDKMLVAWGVKARVLVTTKKGIILYPESFQANEDYLVPPDPIQTASNNYKLLNEGLEVSVDTKLDHNTPLANSLLAFYICVSVCGLYFYYKTGTKKARAEDMEKRVEIDRLRHIEKGYGARIKGLAAERKTLSSEYRRIKAEFEDEQKRAVRNEDEMIEEIVALEKKLEKNLTLQKEQQEEIAVLEAKIRRYEKTSQKDSKQKRKASDAIRKRFHALYKNIRVNERAIGGFVDLTDDLKLKCEEVIHQLNEDAKLIPVKRKVFGRKGRETVFEVMFAYNGRLYYRQNKDNNAEVLTIGTKNTQVKDLEFLDNL